MLLTAIITNKATIHDEKEKYFQSAHLLYHRIHIYYILVPCSVASITPLSINHTCNKHSNPAMHKSRELMNNSGS